MRTTISLPDDLAEAVRRVLAEDRSFSDFARESIALRLEQIEREAIARQMKEGYLAEGEDPSLDPAWADVEVEGW